jgi:hypothetical protein
MAARAFLRVFLLLTLSIAMLAKPALLRSSVYAAGGNNYYVDSVGGSDKNSGTSESQAWSSLTPVHSHSFQPGDVIHFKRGSSWTGGLVIDDSGVAGNPIFFKAYGSGDRPVITNPGSWDSNRWSSAIKIYADWVVVEDFLVRDAHEGGVFITDQADYNVVRNIEATEVGTGVIVSGQYNLVTQSYLHDLKMIHNSPGGNDDWGAVGVGLFGSNNEISYNVMEDCHGEPGMMASLKSLAGKGKPPVTIIYSRTTYPSTTMGFSPILTWLAPAPLEATYKTSR